MLLIHHDKRQVGKAHLLAEQRVRADGNERLP